MGPWYHLSLAAPRGARPHGMPAHSRAVTGAPVAAYWRASLPRSVRRSGTYSARPVRRLAASGGSLGDSGQGLLVSLFACIQIIPCPTNSFKLRMWEITSEKGEESVEFGVWSLELRNATYAIPVESGE